MSFPTASSLNTRQMFEYIKLLSLVIVSSSFLNWIPWNFSWNRFFQGLEGSMIWRWWWCVVAPLHQPNWLCMDRCPVHLATCHLLQDLESTKSILSLSKVALRRWWALRQFRGPFILGATNILRSNFLNASFRVSCCARQTTIYSMYVAHFSFTYVHTD